MGDERVLIGAISTAALFEGAKVEDAGDERPEVWDVGHDDGSRRFACIPIQVDQRAVWSGEICDSI